MKFMTLHRKPLLCTSAPEDRAQKIWSPVCLEAGNPIWREGEGMGRREGGREARWEEG